MKALERLRAVIDNRHEYAQEWKKRTGKKALGYFCIYAPEEIIYAAGMLPVRILGGHEAPWLSEPHILGMFCPYSRDCLTQGLKGRYSYLDGIVEAHSCLHIRQTFDSWRIHIPTAYSHYIFVPHLTQARLAGKLLTDQLAIFKRSLEEWLGKEITTQALDEAIEIYNTNRRLMSELYELRKSDPPGISGAEAGEIVVSAMMMDKAEHNLLLKQALEEVRKRKQEIKSGPRLMMIGSENDDLEFVRFVESLGVNIVIDEQCSGTRYFYGEVIPEDNRLSAIAKRYLEKPPCPNKDLLERRRVPLIMKMAKDYNVQGVLLIQQKFCDPHSLDIPIIRRELEKSGLHTYHYEADVTIPFQQLRTRIEAFIETITPELYSLT